MGIRIRKEGEEKLIQNEEQNSLDIRNSEKMGSTVTYFSGSNLIFENLDWLTTAEAATYLRKFVAVDKPSLNAIHKLVSQGKIRRRKFSGRLYFKRKELDYLIESSGA